MSVNYVESGACRVVEEAFSTPTCAGGVSRVSALHSGMRPDLHTIDLRVRMFPYYRRANTARPRPRCSRARARTEHPDGLALA